MERRKAITVAATASLTLLAGAGGIAISSGILGASADDSVGKISPVATTETPPVTVYVDEPSTPLFETAPHVSETQAPPVTSSAASGVSSRGDDDDGHELEERQHEGADDDD